MSDHSETWEDHENALAAAETMAVLNEAAFLNEVAETVSTLNEEAKDRARRNREIIDKAWAEHVDEQATQEAEMHRKIMDRRRQNFMVDIAPNPHPAEEGEMRVSITYNQTEFRQSFVLTRSERLVLVDALKNYTP